MKVIDVWGIKNMDGMYIEYANVIYTRDANGKAVYVCWNDYEVDRDRVAAKPKLRKEVGKEHYIQIDRQEIRQKVSDCYSNARRISDTEHKPNTFELEYIMNVTLDLVQMEIEDQMRNAFDCGKYFLNKVE